MASGFGRTPALLSINSVDAGAEVLVVLRGELDIETLDTFVQTLAPILRNAPALTIDLGQLAFLDACGAWALVTVVEVLAATDRHLVLLPCPPAVRRVLRAVAPAARLPFADASR